MARIGPLRRLLLRLVRFDSTTSANPALMGLSRLDAFFRADRELHSLLTSYVDGEISGYQCRVYFVDFIRDSLHPLDEMSLRERLADYMPLATLERGAGLEQAEIEAAVAAVIRKVRSRQCSIDGGWGQVDRMFSHCSGYDQSVCERAYRRLCLRGPEALSQIYFLEGGFPSGTVDRYNEPIG